jgi:excinuclease ABC subunit B
MKEAIEETDRRRKKQIDHNEKFKITPQTIKKNILNSLSEEHEFKERETKKLKRKVKDKIKDLEKEADKTLVIEYLENKMFLAAKELRFEDAAYLRDKIKEIKKDYKIKV